MERFWWILHRFWCRNRCPNGCAEKFCAGRFSMVFSMMVLSISRVSLSSLLFRWHHEKCSFTVVKRRFLQHRLVDRLQLRRKFSSQFAIDSQVGFGNVFNENPSKIGFECGSRPTSASKLILGAFWHRFYSLGGASGSSWVPLGDPWGSLGRPWGAPGVPWEGLGAPPGLPGDPLGTHLGPSWAPLGLPGSIWEGLDHQNHEK